MKLHVSNRRHRSTSHGCLVTKPPGTPLLTPHPLSVILASPLMRFRPPLPARAAICSHARPPTPATTTRTSWTLRERSFGRLYRFMEVRTSGLSPPTNHPHGYQHQCATMVLKTVEAVLDLTYKRLFGLGSGEPLLLLPDVLLAAGLPERYTQHQCPPPFISPHLAPCAPCAAKGNACPHLTPRPSSPPLPRLPPTQAPGCAVPTCPSEVPAASLSFVADWMAGMAECPRTFVATLQTEAAAQLVSCLFRK